MRKLFIGVGMVLALGLVANVALSDQTIPFPFYQHGWDLMSFWSVTNDATSVETVTVTIYGLRTSDGSTHFSTTSAIDPGMCWQSATYGGWWTHGAGSGYGKYEITDCTAKTVHLWGAVFAIVTGMQPGYTVIMPANPYGTP